MRLPDLPHNLPDVSYVQLMAPSISSPPQCHRRLPANDTSAGALRSESLEIDSFERFGGCRAGKLVHAVTEDDNSPSL